MVECQLPKLDVAGSTPVSRSNNLFTHLQGLLQNFRLTGLDGGEHINHETVEKWLGSWGKRTETKAPQ